MSGLNSFAFSKEAYDKYLGETEYVHNERIRPEGQNIFDWLMEDPKILDIGADGRTMKETMAMLK